MKYEFFLSPEQEQDFELLGMSFEDEVATILENTERRAMRLKNKQLQHAVSGMMDWWRKLLPPGKDKT